MSLRPAWRQRPWVDVGLLLIAWLGCWEALYLWLGEVVLTPPLATVQHAVALLGSADFLEHLRATAVAFGIALAITAAAGIPAGLILGFFRFGGLVAEPMLTALYSLPKVTLYPLVLLVFGLGVAAKIAFGIMHGIVPVVLTTLIGVRNINPVHLKTARVLGLSRVALGLHVLGPAIVPEIFTGLRIGFSLTLLGVIIGEMFASQRGLGFLIINGINTHDVPTMMAVIFWVLSFAVASGALLLGIDRMLHRAPSSGLGAGLPGQSPPAARRP